MDKFRQLPPKELLNGKSRIGNLRQLPNIPLTKNPQKGKNPGNPPGEKGKLQPKRRRNPNRGPLGELGSPPREGGSTRGVKGAHLKKEGGEGPPPEPP